MGCDAIQGWAVAPVMPADETLAWMCDRPGVEPAPGRDRGSERGGQRPLRLV
jgi:hypothetical protein